MKVVVQIPCLNEAETLPLVIASIPREIEGVDELEILVIDDGSTDRTVEVARNLGVHHVISHARSMGLARSFRDGVDFALARGADVVVNTDGDNQYPQELIPQLIAPVISGEADIAIGDRQTATIRHFSPFKKRMQKFGSDVVNRAAGTDLPDAASGFRAYSKHALLRLNVVTQFSYTMETIIQAGNKRMRIASVPIHTNPKTRESRLFKNIWQHMGKSGQAIVRSYLMFKPHVILGTLAVLLAVVAAIPFVRFGVLRLMGDTGQHIQSLMLGTLLGVSAVLCLALLVIADLLRTNRVLLEHTLERVKDLQYGPSKRFSDEDAPVAGMRRRGFGSVHRAGSSALRLGMHQGAAHDPGNGPGHHPGYDPGNDPVLAPGASGAVSDAGVPHGTVSDVSGSAPVATSVAASGSASADPARLGVERPAR